MKKLLCIIPFYLLFALISCQPNNDISTPSQSIDITNLTKYSWESTKVVLQSYDCTSSYKYVYTFYDNGTYALTTTITGFTPSNGTGTWSYNSVDKTITLKYIGTYVNSDAATYTVKTLSSSKFIFESTSEHMELKAITKKS